MEELTDILNKINNRIKCLEWINIVSIAIFGSSARNEAYTGTNIDLLVVAEDIPKDIRLMVQEIVKIKRALDLGVPLDILLVSKEECEYNFRSHNPLYLDIAIDGKIIYDTNFLEQLVEETREYLKINAIRRGEGSWSFPVKDRVVTNLSEVSNEEWALSWLADSRRDLLAAEYLVSASLYEKSVYHCQQAVEKAMKAIFVVRGEFRRSHFVSEILRAECENHELGVWKERLLRIADIGDIIEPYVSLSRYPRLINGFIWHPYEEYSEDVAKEYIENARYAVKTCGEFIKWWFK